MEYFVDPYKKYYESLKDATSMSTDSTQMGEDVTSLKTNSTSLTSGITTAQWQEMGASTITTTIIPGLTTLLTKLEQDLSSTLAEAVSKASEIVTKAAELKQKDEDLKNKQDNSSNLKNNEPEKYKEGTLEKTEEYIEWETQLEDSKKDVSTLEAECVALQQEIDALASEINALEVSSAEEFTIDTSQTDTGDGGTATQVATDGNIVKLNYSGSTYNVINTSKISVVDFVNYIRSNGLTQTDNQEVYGGECLGVAYAYSNRLYNSGSIPSDMESFYKGSYTANNDKATESFDKQAILGIVYDEIMAGRPCVVQVTTHAGNRHFATCVGFKDTVTSRDTITEEDLLIIDSWDGKLESMDGSNATDDRHLFASRSGGYFVGRLKT
jgi:hypothetical protein